MKPKNIWRWDFVFEQSDTVARKVPLEFDVDISETEEFRVCFIGESSVFYLSEVTLGNRYTTSVPWQLHTLPQEKDIKCKNIRLHFRLLCAML